MKGNRIVRESTKRKKWYFFVSDGEKKPLILRILPILILLLIFCAAFLVYQEFKDETPSLSETASSESGNAGSVPAAG